MLKSRVHEANLRHQRGYNCAQSVVCTYCGLLNMSEADALRAMKAFAGGIAGSGSTCGALCGLLMLAGLKNSNGDVNDRSGRGSTVQLGRQLLTRFKEWNGSDVCRELKGLETGKVLRKCPGCIADAARLAEEVLFEGIFEPYAPRTEEE